MKKQLRFWSVLAICALLFFPSKVNATKVFAVNEDFTSAPTSNWGFGAVSGHAFGYDAVNKRFTLRWSSPTSFTTKTLPSVIVPGSDNKITVEFVAKFYTSGNSTSSGNLYFLDASGNAIFGVWLGRASSQYRIARSTSYPGAVAPTATATTANALAADQPLAKVTAVLDFSTHTLDYTAQVGTFDASTRVFTATTPSVSATAQAFINASASDLNSLLSNFYRVSTTTGTYGYDLMYFGVSTEQTVATANVTVKFKDQDGNYFKADEVVPEQVVASTYNATLSQKSTVSSGGNTYVLDPLSPMNVVVTTEGSTLELLFRKSTTVSTMTWNGTADTNGNLWSEWYQNFVSSSIATAYQTDATATFDATAVNPAVLVNDPISLGTGNVIVSTPGYSFTGGGALTGTGAMSINLTGSDAISLGVTNNLTGATLISGGEITVTKAGALGSSAVVNGTTTFIPSVALPTTTFNISSQINPTAASSIAGITAPNGIKVSVTSSTATVNALSAFLFTPSGTLNGELELNGLAATETRFGMTAANSTYLGNAKVTLKGTSFLYLDVNHTASTINIGTLSGETGTRLGWGRSSATDRGITWSVGSLNENSEYAGTITNLGGYNASGAFWTGQQTNFIKEGTGVLTMSGTSNTHNGNFTVNNGTLDVSGAIGNATSVITVGANGTLKGTGTIGGATTVSGILEGRLNFGSTLALSGITKFVVNGINEGEFDKINVVGEANVGGTFDITVNIAAGVKGVDKVRNANPPVGTRIKLINAGSIVTSLSAIHYPTIGWTLVPASGELIYDPSNVVTGLVNNSDAFRIYPTLTRDNVNVEGNVSAIEVINLAGQKVKQVQANGSKTVVNMNNLSAGAYFVKAMMVDGSVNVQNVILQK